MNHNCCYPDTQQQLAAHDVWFLTPVKSSMQTLVQTLTSVPSATPDPVRAPAHTQPKESVPDNVPKLDTLPTAVKVVSPATMPRLVSGPAMKPASKAKTPATKTLTTVQTTPPSPIAPPVLCGGNGTFVPILQGNAFAFSAYMDSRDGLLKIFVLGDHSIIEGLPLYCLMKFSEGQNRSEETSLGHLKKLRKATSDRTR